MPKMGVNPESIKAPKPVPADWYELKIKELKAKYTKDSKPEEGRINYTAYCEVVNARNPEHNGTFVPMNMNNGPFQGFAVVDLCHGCGLHIEADGTFPGGMKAWTFDSKDPENVDKAQYKGPLLGRTFRAEVITSSYQGQENNKVKQITCKLADCAIKYPEIKHRLDLLGKNK